MKIYIVDFANLLTISWDIKHYDEILYFFIYRLTNASAEFFNSKIKACKKGKKRSLHEVNEPFAEEA